MFCLRISSWTCLLLVGQTALLLSTLTTLQVGATNTTTTDESYRRFSNMAAAVDKMARPYHNDQMLKVQVQIMIVSFGPVKEKDFTFEVDFFLRQWWHEPRIVMGGDETLQISANPYDFLWVPDTQFTNSKATKTHNLLSPTTRVVVKPDGDLYVSTRVTGEFSCKMDLWFYPMDTQICSMIIESYSFSIEDILLEWRKPEVSVFHGGLELSSYSVTNLHTDTTWHFYGSYNFSRLMVHFTVQRSVGNYFYQVYLPSSCLVCLSWGNVWLPAEAVPARVTLIVTTFLATVFILQGASAEITKVDYVTALEVYLCINFSFIFLMLFEYLVVINRKETAEKQLRFSQADETKETSDNDVELELNEHIDKKHKRVDDICKIAFPILYIVTMVMYVYFYAMKSGIFDADKQLPPGYEA